MVSVVISVKWMKKTIVILLTLAVLSCAFLTAPVASAASAGDDIKGNTVCQALSMDGAAYMNWLLSHEHDNYYLGTPYAPWDHRNPNGDCQGAYGYFDEKGVPGMNCMGFIWHVLYKATGFSNGKMSEVERAMTRFGFYRGLNITRRYFKNKEEMLNSGYLDKGDIIWMILDQDENSDSPYHHTGIYWGDGHSDLLWHSNRVTGGQGECNAISKIYPEVDRNTMYIVLKVGAITLSTPKLTSAVNTASGIRVTWDKVDGAAKYRVFKKAAVGWTALGETKGTSFTYTGAAEGDNLLFTVRCITSCSKGYTSMFDSKGIRCQRHDPSAAYAPAVETSGDYEYMLLEDGSVRITRYKGAEAELTIPAKIGTHPVTQIGAADDPSDNAPFAGCRTLTSVTIPDGVTDVGAYAFVNCGSLAHVNFPDSVREIGACAFGTCPKLTGVTLPAGIDEVGEAAFGWTVSDKTQIPAGSFALYGYTGSGAQRYAEREGNAFITFISIGSVIPIIRGDADGDGNVTILDATAIRRVLAELGTTAYEEQAADADGDGDVTIMDATAIQRHLADLPTNESIGKPV